MQEVAYLWTSIAEKTNACETFVDLSDDISRARPGKCLTSGGSNQLHQWWLVRGRRLLTGRELLAMHGVSHDSDVSDTTLLQMAGSTSWSMATCMVLVFEVYAEMHNIVKPRAQDT